MRSNIILITIIFTSLVSISNAKYQVLNDENRIIGRCDNLKIEKDSNGGFARAVFSDCVDNLVFSYSRDFHYRETRS
ncbi:hypothetical protein QIW57_00440 [Francisellaceae bacterium CB52]